MTCKTLEEKRNRCDLIKVFTMFNGYTEINMKCVWNAFINKKYTFCRTRSLFNATFSFLITWRSSNSKSTTVYKISSKSNDFSLSYGNISIFKWRPPAILELFYRHARPPTKSLLLAAAACHVNLIHRCEDVAIWIFRIFGLKCLFKPPKWGFWGNLDP